MQNVEPLELGDDMQSHCESLSSESQGIRNSQNDQSVVVNALDEFNNSLELSKISDTQKISRLVNTINLVKVREAKFRRKYAKLLLENRLMLSLKNKKYKVLQRKYKRLLSKQNGKDELLENVKKIELQGPKKVRDRLLYCEALEKQLSNRKSDLVNVKQKSNFAKCVGGKVMKKYGFVKKFAPFVSPYFQKKFEEPKSVIYVRSKARATAIKSQIIQSVQTFLERDDNSIIAPGINDTVSKGTVVKRKKYLSDTINNLYLKFKEQESLKLSRATFYRAKPFWIIQRKITGRDTCLCRTHSNMTFLIQKLFQLKLLKNVSSLPFVESRVCNRFNKGCFYGECLKCRKKTLFGG